jgi:hypothetical protein
MENIIIFLLGTFFGMGSFIAYSYYQISKIDKIKDTLISQIKTRVEEQKAKNLVTSATIKDRLFKASELAQAQMAIRAQMEAPSKNALHSKYKNGLIGELQDMEQQKIDLLRTVLAEGFDPLITVINETGAKTEIPLSTYVNEASVALGDSLGNSMTPPPTDPTKPRKAGKFMVYRGGKDDGTTH